MDRRDFITRGACVAGGLAIAGLAGCRAPGEGTAGAPPPVADAPPTPDDPPAEAAPDARVGNNRVFTEPPGDNYAVIAADKAPAELVTAAVAAFGGADAIINRGDRVIIKPNLAWARGPDIGATTHPEMLKAVIKMARDAAAGEVLVVEHSCDSAKVAFAMSGGQDACDAMGVRLISLDNPAMYEEKPIKLGVNIKTDQIARDILECDVYINLPCLKHHGATNATITLKNQMGANYDRGRYHRYGDQPGGMNLHQNIADLATALRPTLNIVDAVRVLTSHGPKGPGALEHLNTVIVSHDMVAADAIGADMMGYTVDDVAHIRLAGDAGVGAYDLAGLKVARV